MLVSLFKSGRSNARYGSSSSPTLARIVSSQSLIDSSTCSISTSWAKSLAARLRANSNTCWVTFDVTKGLPSRSPPIQELNFTGAASSGRARSYFASNLVLNSRTKSGTASHSEFSITEKPQRASSTGVGRTVRISSVCQAWATKSEIRVRILSRSMSVKLVWCI